MTFVIFGKSKSTNPLRGRCPGLDRSSPAVLILGVLTAAGLDCRAPGSEPLRSRSRRPQATTPFDPADPQARLAASDPLAFLKVCRAHYVANVADYRCRFTKRERLARGLTAEQEIEVLFREDPYSVDMHWIRNSARAGRVTYVAGRWLQGGHEHAHVQLSGLLGLLLPAGVKRGIHGPEMTADSRRPIDCFGFKNTLDLIIATCEQARTHPDYLLRYLGYAEFAGRPCHVIERRLPYEGEGGAYPNRHLLVYLDREWLVPLGTLAYADDAEEVLLGSYILADVEFNIGLTDADF